MRILCIDVGTGTQDILLFDSEQEIENCVQLIMPSPTQIVARRVREATAVAHTLLLTGVTMGGGPGAWAVEEHIRAGLHVYATPAAARTFDDDLQRVEAMGVRVVEPLEVAELWQSLGPSRATLIKMQDVDLEAIDRALADFHEPARYDALAVAVFDHGAAPPGYSDRRFRFDYISRQMEQWGHQPVEQALAAFAAPADRVHPDLTRLRAVARTVQESRHAGLPLLLMDTGPAALLGALGDPVVAQASKDNALFVNTGNFHTLAFHIVGGRIRALFEHHTGLLDGPRLLGLLERLVAGTLTNREIFDDNGHGALNLPARSGNRGQSQPQPQPQPQSQSQKQVRLCAVTGPRRAMLTCQSAPWPVYMAVPHGDMMLTGCFGLLRAFAVHFPALADQISARLNL
jgi:uncharacterized protein (DUF1786 family)